MAVRRESAQEPGLHHPLRTRQQRFACTGQHSMPPRSGHHQENPARPARCAGQLPAPLRRSYFIETFFPSSTRPPTAPFALPQARTRTAHRGASLEWVWPAHAQQAIGDCRWQQRRFAQQAAVRRCWFFSLFDQRTKDWLLNCGGLNAGAEGVSIRIVAFFRIGRWC